MSSRRVEAFLLKLVVDPEEAASSQWRGRVQHIGSGDEQLFQHVEDLLTFIRDQVYAEPQRPLRDHRSAE